MARTIILILASVFFILSAPSGMADELEVEFTKEDLELLREIQRIRDIGRSTAELFLTAPVIQAIGNPIRASVAVTLVTSDLAGVTRAASQMNRIVACRVNALLIEHLLDPPPAGPRRDYFHTLRVEAEARCDPM